MSRQFVLADDGVHRFHGVVVDLFGRRQRLRGRHLIDRKSRRHAERVAVVGAVMRHAVVDDGLHDFRSATERGQRQTAADGLGQRDQVRLDAQSRGGAASARGQAGLDLVEDQQDVVGVAQCADARNVASVGQHDAEVFDDRFHDYAGHVLAVGGQHAFHLSQVVIGHHVHDAGFDVEGHLRDRVVCGTDLVDARLDRHRQPVVAAVVAAFDLDDGFPAGVGASGAHRVPRRLGAGVGEPQHVQTEAFLEPFGDLGRDRRRRHEQRADVVEELFDLGDHRGVEVADEHRAEPHRQIQHLAVVAVGDIGAAGGLHTHRIRVPVLEAAGHTQRQGLRGPRGMVGRTGSGGGIAFPLLGHQG